MSSYVSGNRLRSHIASGTFGAGGTATTASGLIAIPHGFPANAPTAWGITLDDSGAGATALLSRIAYARLSGLFIVGLIVSIPPAVAATSSCNGVWWAKV